MSLVVKIANKIIGKEKKIITVPEISNDSTHDDLVSHAENRGLLDNSHIDRRERAREIMLNCGFGVEH